MTVDEQNNVISVAEKIKETRDLIASKNSNITELEKAIELQGELKNNEDAFDEYALHALKEKMPSVYFAKCKKDNVPVSDLRFTDFSTMFIRLSIENLQSLVTSITKEVAELENELSNLEL